MRISTLTSALAVGTAIAVVTATPALAAPAWHVVPSGNASGQNELGDVAVVSATEAWAVGDAYPVVNNASQQVPLIEHYTGTAWQVVPAPEPAGFAYGWLSAVTAVSGNDVWAVGQTLSADHMRTGTPIVNHYDGTTWSLVTVPQVDPRAGFSAVAATSSTDVWAVGYTGTHPKYGASVTNPLVEHFDGTAWSIVPTPALAATSLSGVVAVSPTNVWAVGDSTGTNGVQNAMALHYDGTAWTQVALPAGPAGATSWALHQVDGAAGQAWAVGDYTLADGSQHALVAHLAGTGWSVSTLPDPASGRVYSSLTDVAVTSASDVWAVGNSSAGNQQSGAYTEHFDGTAWRLVAPATVNPGEDSLTGVGTGAGQVWAVGYTAPASNSGAWQTMTQRYS